MIAQRIYEKISLITSVNSAVNGNIFLGEQPENTPKPFIVYAFNGSTPIKTLTGNSNLKSEIWTVKLTGSDYSALDSIKDTLIDEFNSERANFTATLSDIDIDKDRQADLDHFTLYFQIHFY